MAGGFGYDVNWRSKLGSRNIAKQPKSTLGKSAAKVTGSVQKGLDTLDKLHEKQLKNSGLLDDKAFTVELPDVNNELQKIDMFKRAPGNPVSLNPIDYVKNTTKGAFDRVQVNPQFIEEGGDFNDIVTTLSDRGFSEDSILSIANQSKGVVSVPPEFASMDLGPNTIVDPNLTREEFLSSKEMDLGITEDITKGNTISSIQAKAGKSFTDAGFNLDVKGDVSALGKSIFGKGAELVDDVTKFVPDKIVKSLDVLEDMASGAGGKILEAGGKVGGLAGKALPIAGQVMGGLKSVKGLTNIFKEGGDKAQGVEDAVQGAIMVAAPFLISAGPVGWAVLGASFLEDMLFD
tara:strand:+ start:12692 stop:13732 length:1041 start_codon:yes stop_codon:yes gene_type:complete